MKTPDARAIPRVGIDIRYLSHGLLGGVRSYVLSLTSALLRVAPEQPFVLCADTKASVELPQVPAATEVRCLPWHGQLSSILNDRRVGLELAKAGARVAHFPANYGFAPPGIAVVVTVHDAINLMPLPEILHGHPKHPRTMLMMTYLHLVTKRSLRSRPLVVTVSEYSRREIIRRSGIPDERVRVVYQAPDSAFRRLDDHTVRAFAAGLGLRPRVLLADAIKNAECTLRAYRALPFSVRQNTSLVFFARREPDPAIRRAADGGECMLLLRPGADMLVKLYNAADLFVFPSWFEGFGLPAVEAMACGTPVIASSRGSLPEVVGGGGVIVDADDHGAIARHITALLLDDEAYASLRKQALLSAGRFSWDRSARQMLQLYDEAATACRVRGTRGDPE
jgi:glycosyltransferase involved in cell wall biosynthesis